MKRLFLSILLCVFVWGMKAQEMDAVFVAMPDQYVPQLENAWRKDLIDLYNSGKEAKLKNTMNGFSTLKKLTDDYLLLQVTERSTVEMKLLPLVNDTYVVCMITTVYGPVPDSQVEFFTTDWKLLDSADLYTPGSNHRQEWPLPATLRSPMNELYGYRYSNGRLSRHSCRNRNRDQRDTAGG